MVPDVRTMWMVVATTAVLFGCLEIWAGSGRQRDSSMMVWGCANLAGGVGAGLLSSQGVLPYAVSEAVANGFLVLVWALFAYLPFSKLAHLVYRTVAMAYNEYAGRNF